MELLRPRPGKQGAEVALAVSSQIGSRRRAPTRPLRKASQDGSTESGMRTRSR